MKQIAIIIIFICCSLYSFADKDRIERPVSYTFIFQNNDTVILKKQDTSLLRIYTNDIISRKRNLIEAYVTFENGETLIFNESQNRWTTIKVKIKNKEIEIPKKILSKITEVHFDSIALLWNGFYESASAAGGFYLRFDIGVEKSFGNYPYLELFFSNKGFKNADIWRQINERTTQWAKF